MTLEEGNKTVVRPDEGNQKKDKDNTRVQPNDVDEIVHQSVPHSLNQQLDTDEVDKKWFADIGSLVKTTKVMELALAGDLMNMANTLPPASVTVAR